MEQGLLAEAKMLYELKLDDSHTAMQAIGYKEFFPFSGECTLRGGGFHPQAQYQALRQKGSSAGFGRKMWSGSISQASAVRK